MENDGKVLIDIPSEFFSFETGGLFKRCIECDRDLLADNCEYMIERAIRNYQGYKAKDVIFDYAICMDCAQAMHSKLSKESLEQIQTYFFRNVDMEARLKDLDLDNLETCTEKCMIKDTLKDDCEEFQIYAHCIGDQLFLNNPPYMVSGAAIEELTEVLSKSTKEELGGFFDKHFGPDPTLFEKSPKRRLILV